MTNPADKIPSSQITPLAAYLSRRSFMRAGIVAGTTVATGLVYRRLNRVGNSRVETRQIAGLVQGPATQGSADGPAALASGFRTDEAPTSLKSVTNYNNFYEFSTDKEGVAGAAAGFVTSPWQVTIDGLVGKPGVMDIDDIRRFSPPEERVYRMRCVEGWSMVIPWAGLPLARLLERVEPLSDARYVAFQTLLDPRRMPNQRTGVLDWPYVEGLRMDEAMHPLTILAIGLYGRELPAQNGAPLRLVVPWKYGFKGIKSIVKITLLAKRPPTTWALYAPDEYGFYANVNPQVSHPRWSQATEQRIGESGRRPTVLFNGYAQQVASLYSGLDLRKNF